MKIWTDENRKRIVNILFYIALSIELLIMVVEKSELTFSHESYVFRMTFLLTFFCVLVMKHDKREWAVILVILALSAYAYIHSGKNDLLRLSLFLMAARDIDLKKAMKYSFYFCAAGFLVIFLLSVLGIMGDIALVADFGRGDPNEKRYVFGFGHPNTLFGCMYAMLLMWIWIYAKSSKWYGYVVVVAFVGVVTMLTASRTGMLVCGMTIVLVIIARIFPKLSSYRILYILGTLFSTVLSVVLTILAAWEASMYYLEGVFHGKFWQLETLINFRISNLYYSTEDRGGVLYRWKLFAGHGSDSYFDMGWARLFYWYGIIPTVIIILAIFAVVYVSRKKSDIWTLVLVISLSIYTLLEATFITRYLGRDFFLLIGGVYLGYYFRTCVFKIDDKEGNANAGQA